MGTLKMENRLRKSEMAHLSNKAIKQLYIVQLQIYYKIINASKLYSYSSINAFTPDVMGLRR